MFLGPNVSKTEAEKTEDIVRSTAEFSLGARVHCTIWHVTVSQREALVNSHLRQAGSTCSAMSRTFSVPIFLFADLSVASRSLRKKLNSDFS